MSVTFCYSVTIIAFLYHALDDVRWKLILTIQHLAYVPPVPLFLSEMAHSYCACC